MKRLTIIISALALVLGMSQCRKNVEQMTPSGQTTGEKVYVTLNVDLGDAKTEIDATGNVKWESGDKIYVVGEDQGLLGSIQPSNPSTLSASATFSGIINNISSTQYLRFYYVGNNEFTLDNSGNTTFSIASQNGSLAGIADNNQIMWGKSASEIAAGATALGSVTMTSLIAIAHLNINDGGEPVSGTVTVTGGNASATFNAKTYDGSALSGTEGNITMAFVSPTTSTNCYIALLPGAQALKFSANGKEATLGEKNVEANKFYNSGTAIAVSVEASGPQAVGWENATSPYAFSVSSTKKVYFSQGNLQWSRTNGTSTNTTHNTAGDNSSSPYGNEGTWRFAEHQFDCIGADNAKIAEDYQGWIDLFGWATSGWKARSSGECCYMPYETSTSGSYYGPPTSIFSLTGEYKKSDWGVYNDISNDGDLGVGAWRTLTFDTGEEWPYLVNYRTNASTLWGKGKVEDICGLIILPDDFDWTSTGLSQWTTSGYESNYTDNVYTYSDWHAMETEGAVFLPAAGYRNSSTISDVGTDGYYWSVSATMDPFKPGGRTSAYSVKFSGHYIYYQFMQTEVSQGCSVRLVRDVIN